MIIFGTKAKMKTVGEGEFYCPHCQHERHYERKQVKKYFSLYFIPVFPVGDLGEIIECTRCGRSYKTDVLDRKLSKPQPDAARLINNLKTQLHNGDPIEYAVRDLTMAGIDLDLARNMVTMAVGEDRKECSHCELTYAGSVTHCTVCYRSLDANS
jgi:hypothetical protein